MSQYKLQSNLVMAAMQGRARDKALVELLIEKGIFTREEFVSRSEEIFEKNKVQYSEEITGKVVSEKKIQDL